MIAAVALNPALDTTLWLDRLAPDETAVPGRERTDPAGKAVNVARVLASLGRPCRLFGVLGGGNGARFRSLLGECGVTGEFLEVPGFVRENLSLVVGGELYKIDRAGFDLSGEMLARLGERLRGLPLGQAPLLVFAGSLPGGMSPREYRDFILPFRKAGARIVLDNAFWTPADLRVLRPFAIKPNRGEFCRLMGREFAGMDGLLDAAASLSETVEHVLVSLGGEGIAYAGGGMRLRAAVPAVEVRSCVGAGDSALAGFLAALEAGCAVETGVRFAAACGTAAVGVEGTGVLQRERAEALFSQVRLKESV